MKIRVTYMFCDNLTKVNMHYPWKRTPIRTTLNILYKMSHFKNSEANRGCVRPANITFDLNTVKFLLSSINDLGSFKWRSYRTAFLCQNSKLLLRW